MLSVRYTAGGENLSQPPVEGLQCHHFATVLNFFPEPFFLYLMPGVAEVIVLTLPFLYLVICRPCTLGADFFGAFGLAVRLAGMLCPAANAYVPSVNVQARLGSEVSSTFRTVMRLFTAMHLVSEQV